MPGAAARLAAAWSPAVRARSSAFTATGLLFAADALACVLPALDAYADGWGQGYVAACRAARVERTQSPALSSGAWPASTGVWRRCAPAPRPSPTPMAIPPWSPPRSPPSTSCRRWRRARTPRRS
ncbi:MAG: hypothetical protein HS111_31665 [Kofleriaceae bacterium]|nr:hypothetical protein [Kofleriaceae bacterium]